MNHTVFLALGSNQGDRQAYLEAALSALAPHAVVQARSPIYETEPWGFIDQPWFLNQVVKIKTDLDPHALLAHLKGIESRLGRQKTFRYGPRVIDLDVLFYNDRIIKEASLTIPHPHLHERPFVLVPLTDLAPDLVHPILGQPVRNLLEALDLSGVEPFKG